MPFALRFLYNEILKYQEGNDDCIFEPAEKNKLQVKPDITFHLYIRSEIFPLLFSLVGSL